MYAPTGLTLPAVQGKGPLESGPLQTTAVWSRNYHAESSLKVRFFKNCVRACARLRALPYSCSRIPSATSSMPPGLQPDQREGWELQRPPYQSASDPLFGELPTLRKRDSLDRPEGGLRDPQSSLWSDYGSLSGALAAVHEDP